MQRNPPQALSYYTHTHTHTHTHKSLLQTHVRFKSPLHTVSMLHRGTLSRKGLASNYKDYSDFFYNDITEGDHQEPGSSPCPCDSGEGLRWEKNFIMMEDLHVMHKILLQANEELKMEISSLRNHMQKLSRDISTTCLRVVGETCRSMNAQQNLTGKQNSTQLKQEVQQNGNVTDNVMEEMEEVRRREMKDLKNVHRMMEMDKTENMEENAEWGRWIKWIFW